MFISTWSVLAYWRADGISAMKKAVFMALPLLLLIQVSTIQAQNKKPVEVPIANLSGVKLLQSPSSKSSVIKKLGVGDGVHVIRTRLADGENGAKEQWAYVQFYRSMSGRTDTANPKGWVLDKDLGYQNRFQKITSWKKERTSGELGDYGFTMEVRRDGSFVHKYSPCVDCGEKPGCDKG